MLRVEQTCHRRRGTAEFDRACVKTHTSAKCRKHNSPARHRTSRVQYDLTLRDAIAQRYFYVRNERRSFRTAKTQSGHERAAFAAVGQPSAANSLLSFPSM